jgi:hypothetical protein
MIKGITKRVIVVKSPDPDVFEEAIFIVREDAFSKNGMSATALLCEAQKIANGYAGASVKKSRRLPPLFYAVVGAGLTSLIWLLSTLIQI